MANAALSLMQCFEVCRRTRQIKLRRLQNQIDCDLDVSELVIVLDRLMIDDLSTLSHGCMQRFSADQCYGFCRLRQVGRLRLIAAVDKVHQPH